MPDAGSLALFVLAATALIVVPGPAVLYIVAQSIHGGRRAGLVSALGVATGGLVHIAAVTVGLSSLLLRSAEAYAVLRYVGAAYLVYLGVKTLLARDAAVGGPQPERSQRHVYRRGVVVNVLNPKTALFFLAFLPQFVDPKSGHVPLQLAMLGAIFVVLALCSDSLWALAAGSAADRLRRSRRFLHVQRYLSGSVYLGLGALTAFAGTHRLTKSTA